LRQNLDESQPLIVSAFYSVKPPQSGPRRQAAYPPPESYYWYFTNGAPLEPNNASIVFVTKQIIIRFPWSDPVKECGPLLLDNVESMSLGGTKQSRAIAVAVAMRTQRAAGEVAGPAGLTPSSKSCGGLEHPILATSSVQSHT
jgi:hypothetical protein